MVSDAPAHPAPHVLSLRSQQDMALIDAALAGDAKAYAALLDTYRKPVSYVVLKIVGNTDDAEDLTLEVFTKAFKYLANYRPDFAFSTWLFRIATNHSIDFIRRQKLPMQSLTQSDEENLPLQVRDPAPNPQEAFIRQQRIDLMHKLTNVLPLKYARPVRLRYFQQLSYLEMATELKLPVGTVKARLFRARVMLRALLQNSRAAI
ncbi:sigma-70 family RNA polymerase sigma factor [Hymenobacter sp. YC55]|uniref:RNA polymerase sigma factor n=1 Tax=Hymenobacter sp. YC55 TaxID=3034019 RepID=UPI0023F9B780|nr:sigma-70 family RNA polymerase sigma factor [Hymenobacter sp. YC55]MDF7814779.1 sigma-70 family RNA polymerase sigma factor [Hymenobacter sp. YC55]